MGLRSTTGRVAAATVPVALAFLALAVVEVSYFPGRDSALHVAALRAKAVVLAELTANSAVPALEFEDDAVLSEFLNGAARDRDVVEVVACSRDGQVIGAAGRQKPHGACRAVTTTQVELDSSVLRVTTPIAAKTHPGTLRIGLRTDGIALARDAAERVALAIAAGILLLGLGVTWWIGRVLRKQQALLEENRAARAHAEAASEAKSAFLANMSHEIRTPMNGVIGVTQLLARSTLNDVQRRHVQTIVRSGELLLAIINDILDFSKVEAGKLTLTPEPTALRPFLAEVCDSVRAAAEAKGLTLEYEVEVDVPEAVNVDALRLQQVLSNLLANAIKFTASGSVGARVRRQSADAQDQKLRFEVSDTGIGIEAAHHAGLFEAFTQVDELSTRRYGGTGLGLAICKRLVTLMNGTLGVESTPCSGSTFWFVLPLPASERKAASVGELSIAPRSASSARRLLAVDDNEINRGVIEHFAQELGYEVQLAEGGREALERVKAGEQYAAILMDCQMPDVDGYMATREIRSWEEQTQSRHLPIIAVTAHALDGEQEKVHAAGMDDYLPKPVRLNSLQAMLEKWIPASGEAQSSKGA